LLTPDEAARVSGRNPEQVRQWIRDGVVPAHRVGRRWLIPDEGLKKIDARPRLRLPRPTLER
jgi:excisionase family DNA binding protein